MPDVLAVDDGLSLSESDNHARPRESFASRETILGAPVPRLEAGSPRRSASHNTADPDGGPPWLYSFPSADQTKMACLDDALSAEAIREAARRANGSAGMEARGACGEDATGAKVAAGAMPASPDQITPRPASSTAWGGEESSVSVKAASGSSSKVHESWSVREVTRPRCCCSAIT